MLSFSPPSKKEDEEGDEEQEEEENEEEDYTETEPLLVLWFEKFDDRIFHFDDTLTSIRDNRIILYDKGLIIQARPHLLGKIITIAWEKRLSDPSVSPDLVRCFCEIAQINRISSRRLPRFWGYYLRKTQTWKSKKIALPPTISIDRNLLPTVLDKLAAMELWTYGQLEISPIPPKEWSQALR